MNPEILQNSALLLTACLFGGMVFFSAGFAPVLFKQLGIEQVRPLLRGTFPYYYWAIIALSGIATVVAATVSLTPALILAGVCISTVFARQILMPMINAATDAQDKKRFGTLHGLSVILQLIQIAVSGWALVILS